MGSCSLRQFTIVDLFPAVAAALIDLTFDSLLAFPAIITDTLVSLAATLLFSPVTRHLSTFRRLRFFFFSRTVSQV